MKLDLDTTSENVLLCEMIGISSVQETQMREEILTAREESKTVSEIIARVIRDEDAYSISMFKMLLIGELIGMCLGIEGGRT